MNERSPPIRKPRTRRCKTMVERDVGAMASARLLADLPAQCDRLRRLSAYALRHRAEQSLRHRGDDRQDRDDERRVRPGGRWCTCWTSARPSPVSWKRRGRPSTARFSMSATTRTTTRCERSRRSWRRPIPAAELSYGPPGGDNRSYRVSFDKIHDQLPGFRCAWDARKGARQLHDVFERIGIDCGRIQRTAFHAPEADQVPERLGAGRRTAFLARIEPSGAMRPKIVFLVMSAVSKPGTIDQLARALAPHIVLVHHDFSQTPNFPADRAECAVRAQSQADRLGRVRVCRRNFSFLAVRDWRTSTSITCNCSARRACPSSPFEQFEAHVSGAAEAHFDCIDLLRDRDALMSVGYRAFTPEESFRHRVARRLHRAYFGAEARPAGRSGHLAAQRCRPRRGAVDRARDHQGVEPAMDRPPHLRRFISPVLRLDLVRRAPAGRRRHGGDLFAPRGSRLLQPLAHRR